MCLMSGFMWLPSWKVLMGLPWCPAAAFTIGVAIVVACLSALACRAGWNARLLIGIAAFADDPCVFHIVSSLSLPASPTVAVCKSARSTRIWAVRIVVFIQGLRLSDICKVDWVGMDGVNRPCTRNRFL